MRTNSTSSQPGPSATAPVASSALDVAAHHAQSQGNVHALPHQQVHEQSSAPQVATTLPVSWADTRQAISQATARSSDAASHHGQPPNSYQGFTKGALQSATFLGAWPSQKAPNGVAPNRAAPASPTLRTGGCTGVTVSRQGQAHEQEPSRGRGHGQVKVQDYAPAPVEVAHAAPHTAAQHAQQAAAQHAQQAATWAVEQLPEGQYVCVMQDGAKLTLEQLYYTLEHVGKSLPEDKYEALSMMIKQLTERGEKYEPQSVVPTSGPQ